MQNNEFLFIFPIRKMLKMKAPSVKNRWKVLKYEYLPMSIN